MANLTYRVSDTPVVPGTTVTKGAPLTNLEVDANFKSIQTDLEKLVVDDDITTDTTYYPILATTNDENYELKTASTKLQFNPSTGQLSTTDYNSTSDKKLKTDFENINSLDILNSIDAYKFKWIENGKISYGLIAQELENVLPELVSEREDGYKGISYIPLIAILVDGIKQLSKRIDELEK